MYVYMYVCMYVCMCMCKQTLLVGPLASGHSVIWDNLVTKSNQVISAPPPNKITIQALKLNTLLLRFSYPLLIPQYRRSMEYNIR